MGYFNNEIAIDIENQIKEEYRNGAFPESDCDKDDGPDFPADEEEDDDEEYE